MLQGLLKSCVIIAFPCFVFYGQRVSLCLIAPKWQIMPLMIWWKCEIIKLLRRLAACVYSFRVFFFCFYKFMPWGFKRPSSYFHKFTSTAISRFGGGVITWKQNGFISFNPAGAAICTGNICNCGVCTVKQLKTTRVSNTNKVEGGCNRSTTVRGRQGCV